MRRMIDPTQQIEEHVDRRLGALPQRDVLAGIDEATRPLGQLKQRVGVAYALPRGTPTVTANANAGATATASVSGTDTAGTITLVPNGAGIASGGQVTLTFASPKSSTSYAVLVTASNVNAGAVGFPLRASTKTTSTVLLSIATALSAGTTYTWDYWIVQWDRTG